MFREVPRPKIFNSLQISLKEIKQNVERYLQHHRRFSGSWSHLWERLPWLVVQPCSCRQYPHPGEEANSLGSDEPSYPVCSCLVSSVILFSDSSPSGKGHEPLIWLNLTFFNFTNSFSAAVRLLISSSYLELKGIKSNWVRGEDDTRKSSLRSLLPRTDIYKWDFCQ